MWENWERCSRCCISNNSSTAGSSNTSSPQDQSKLPRSLKMSCTAYLHAESSLLHHGCIHIALQPWRRRPVVHLRSYLWLISNMHPNAVSSGEGKGLFNLWKTASLDTHLGSNVKFCFKPAKQQWIAIENDVRLQICSHLYRYIDIDVRWCNNYM